MSRRRRRTGPASREGQRPRAAAHNSQADRDEWQSSPLPPNPNAWLALTMPAPAGPLTTQSTQVRPDGTVLVRETRDGVVREYVLTDVRG